MNRAAHPTKNSQVETPPPPRMTLLAPYEAIQIPEVRKFLLVESGIQLKESGIPLTFGILNPSSTDKEFGIQYRESRIQDPRFPHVWRYSHITNFYGLFCRQARFDGAGLKFHVKCAAEFKTCYRLWFGPLRSAVIICHPDTIKVIQSSNAPKERFVYNFVRPFLGKGQPTQF